VTQLLGDRRRSERPVTADVDAPEENHKCHASFPVDALKRPISRANRRADEGSCLPSATGRTAIRPNALRIGHVVPVRNPTVNPRPVPRQNRRAVLSGNPLSIERASNRYAKLTQRATPRLHGNP
jgi:hypothetical protein